MDKKTEGLLCSHFSEEYVEAGVDEAGRGCYAGPVVAAAVILPRGYQNPLLNDSKKLSATLRYTLRTEIEKNAVAVSWAIVHNTEIDKINILQATYKAMHLAIKGLSVSPQLLLIDGNRFKPYESIPHHCIIKGDGKYASIAAASIIAKTYRDDLMETLDAKYPMYYWKKNKGYGSEAHRKAIAQFGLCPYHRRSFNILPAQLSLPL